MSASATTYLLSSTLHTTSDNNSCQIYPLIVRLTDNTEGMMVVEWLGS
ncbi:hypothetical protein ACGVWS_06855 [Enterobacteriaceae bacterium LUAb1]